MADDRPDVKVQLVFSGDFSHWDFRGDGEKGAADGERHRTIGEIDERFDDSIRDEVIALVESSGDQINKLLGYFNVLGARLQVRIYDE